MIGWKMVGGFASGLLVIASAFLTGSRVYPVCEIPEVDQTVEMEIQRLRTDLAVVSAVLEAHIQWDTAQGPIQSQSVTIEGMPESRHEERVDVALASILRDREDE